jgi:hypothetical protein
LLEVTGHVLASDRDPVAVSDQFSDRLVACVDVQRNKWSRRLPKYIYIAGPLAAAAVIALALIGFFDSGGPTQVAGEKAVRELNSDDSPDIDAILQHLDSANGDDVGMDSGDPPAPWLRGVEDNVEALQQSGSVLQQLPLTLLEPLEQLKHAKDGDAAPDVEASGDADVDDPTAEDAESGDEPD